MYTAPTIAPPFAPVKLPLRYHVLFVEPTHSYHIVGPGNTMTYCGLHPDNMTPQGIFDRVDVTNWDRGAKNRLCRRCFIRYNRSRSS